MKKEKSNGQLHLEENDLQPLPTTYRSIRYDFTAPETHEQSMQLANKLQEIERVKSQKKSQQAACDATIKSLSEEMLGLSNNISSGYEYRNIECIIEYHKPEQGKKTLIRKDNMQVLAVEKMEQHEWTLFTQADDIEMFDEKKYAKAIL